MDANNWDRIRFGIRVVSLLWGYVGFEVPDNCLGKSVSYSVMSDSLLPHETTRLLCGILQTRILEWVAIPFSRESSWPRDWTRVSCIAGGFFTVWSIRGMWLQNREILIWNCGGGAYNYWGLSAYRQLLKVLEQRKSPQEKCVEEDWMDTKEPQASQYGLCQLASESYGVLVKKIPHCRCI